LAVQAKQQAQQQSCSILDTDDESVEIMESSEDVEDSKPAAATAVKVSKPVSTIAVDISVDYGDNFFELMKIQDYYCD